MEWDPQKRQYVDSDGNPIPPSQIREYIDQFIENSQKEVSDQADALRAGEITVAIFFAWLADKIINMHGTAAVIAYGGEDEMNPDRWARVGEKIYSELEYLKGFEQDAKEAYATTETIAHEVAREISRSHEVDPELVSAVQDNVFGAILENSVSDVELAVGDAIRETLGNSVSDATTSALIGTVKDDVIDPASSRLENLIWGEVGSRGRAYADAAYGTYENSVRAREGDAGATGVRRVCEDDAASCEDCPLLATDDYVSIDEIADIGDSQCSGNCRCYFEFSFLGVEPLEIEREIYA